MPGIATNLTDRGNDSAWGYGFQIGALWDINPMFSLGASYRTKMYMSEFDKYSDLFADNGDFDMPAVAAIGAAFRPNERLTLALDVQWIGFGDIDAVANDNNLFEKCNLFNPMGYDARYCLGGSKGAGFGWDDMTVFKLGAQYEINDQWTVQAGYSHGDQPIDGSQVAFNALAPGGHRGSLYARRKLASARQLRGDLLGHVRAKGNRQGSRRVHDHQRRLDRHVPVRDRRELRLAVQLIDPRIMEKAARGRLFFRGPEKAL